MTREQILTVLPNASESFISKNCDRTEGLRPGDAQRTEGHALERPVPREEKGRVRAAIHFRIFSRHPADWDAYHIKELQDSLCHAGILDGDDWDLLEGQVTSEKVHTKAEEKTEITIFTND